MKKVKYPNLNDYDLSAYEELKGDILYRINGGKVMDQADMYAMQQADAHHDEETKEEILKNYENTETPSSTPPTDTQMTPPATNTTPTTTNTTTTPTTNNPTTSPTTTTEDPKQNPKPSTTSGGSTDGGTTTPTNSGNNSTGGTNNYNGSGGNTGNNSQNNKPVSEEERYYQAGLAHVEDYKNAALNNSTIKGNDVSVREMGGTTGNEKGHSHHSGTFGEPISGREVSGSHVKTENNNTVQVGLGVGVYLGVAVGLEIGVSYSEKEGWDIYRTIGGGCGVGITGDITFALNSSDLGENKLHKSTGNSVQIGVGPIFNYTMENHTANFTGVGGIGVGGGTLWTYTRTIKGDIKDLYNTVKSFSIF